jgi:hypothetical protein
MLTDLLGGQVQVAFGGISHLSNTSGLASYVHWR